MAEENNNPVQEKLKATADNLSTDLQELKREIYNEARRARKDAINQLYAVADQIRARTRDVEGEARDNANQVARNLEQTANYLNARAIDQAEDLAANMRASFWQTVMAAFVVGLLVGLFLSRRG
jgi:ElaB/YqjD/DUF883 family membrane-anchored ribosome-binding protein